MSDLRKKARKRTQLLTIRLYEEEGARLRQLAEENHRTPGDQVRALIAQAPLQTELRESLRLQAPELIPSISPTLAYLAKNS